MGSYELEEGEIVEEYGSDVFLDERVRCGFGDVLKDFEGVVFKLKLGSNVWSMGNFFPHQYWGTSHCLSATKISPPPPPSTDNNMGLQPKKRTTQVFEDSEKKTSLASQVNNARKKMKATTIIEQKDQQPSQVNVDGAPQDERVKMFLATLRKVLKEESFM